MAGLEAVLAAPPRSGSSPAPLEHRKLVELDEKSGTLQNSRRNYWALTICAHCRDYTSSTCVFACYGKLAHHREVVLVDGHGARESVGVLCDGQQGVPSPAEGVLGTIEDLDLEYVVDRRVKCMVSCELCAGLPLGGCIDRGHQQQVGGGGCLSLSRWLALQSCLLGCFPVAQASSLVLLLLGVSPPRFKPYSSSGALYSAGLIVPIARYSA